MDTIKGGLMLVLKIMCLEHLKNLKRTLCLEERNFEGTAAHLCHLPCEIDAAAKFFLDRKSVV